MRAARYHRYGPPHVLTVGTMRAPEPGPGEVQVAVHVTSVNRTDCGFLRGKPRFVRLFSGLITPKRPVLGTEFAGEVTKTGPGVRLFDLGQRVFGYTGDRFGAHAEFLTIAERAMIAPIPAGLSYAEVAPSSEGAHYALTLLRAARVRPGQKVLVNGATGAIGSAAVQLLVERGVNVTAVAPTEHLGLVRSLGADRVIDFRRQDFTRLPDRFDVVFDAVGKSSFRRCRRLLTSRGLYVSTDLGFLSQNPLLALLTPLFRRRRVLFPIPRDTREDLLFLARLLHQGSFRPVVDREYPLDQIRQAVARVESGQKLGNVLIRVRPGD